MVTIKHKVTLKTKTAQEETPAVVESSVVTLKRKQPETPAPNTEEIKKEQPEVSGTPVTTTPSEPEKKSHTGKVVGGVVAAAAILAGIYFFGIKNDDTKTVEDKVQTEEVAQVDNSANTPEETDASATDAPANTSESGEGAVENETIAAHPSAAPESSAANETSVATAGSKASTTAKPKDKPASQPVQQSQPRLYTIPQPSTPNASDPLSSDVAENARRVIRGDFGNGKERKDKLGAAYPEIQSKVNEMYRQKYNRQSIPQDN